jgi:protein-S-isoprenylcysteine O-methyltransferase Ste14
MAAEERRDGSKRWGFLTGFKNLLGVGPHLIVLGLFFEGLTVLLRRWVSFPIPLPLGVQFMLTIPCLFLAVGGTIWFNLSLDLIEVNLRRGRKELVTGGPFAYVRHPLYTTLMMAIPPLFIIWFADFLFFIPWGLILIVSHFVVRLEERGLVDTFGQEYERYREKVPSLVPYKGAGATRFHDDLEDDDRL